jgi:large subunit ribosomal protein L29
MKAAEIREISQNERLNKVKDKKEELFNLRFQKETGNLENMWKIRQTKRDIAKLKTIIREKALP